MSCRFSYYKHEDLQNRIRQVQSDVDMLDRRQARDLKDFFAEISRRLDDIEKAVLEPDGQVAENLRAKHGIGKARRVKPLPPAKNADAKTPAP